MYRAIPRRLLFTLGLLFPLLVACVYNPPLYNRSVQVSRPSQYQSWTYYYYPDVEVYFDYTAGYYYYSSNGAWIRTRYLPSYFHLDLSSRVELLIKNDRPYLLHEEHVKRYPRNWRDSSTRHHEHSDSRDDKHDNRGTNKWEEGRNQQPFTPTPKPQRPPDSPRSDGSRSDRHNDDRDHNHQNPAIAPPTRVTTPTPNAGSDRHNNHQNDKRNSEREQEQHRRESRDRNNVQPTPGFTTAPPPPKSKPQPTTTPTTADSSRHNDRHEDRGNDERNRNHQKPAPSSATPGGTTNPTERNKKASEDKKSKQKRDYLKQQEQDKQDDKNRNESESN